jgi:hypothetical protein
MKRISCIFIANLIFIASYAQLKTAETNHYLFPEFTQGVVLLKTGKKDAKLLNYNSLTGEMIFDHQGSKLAIAKADLGRIDSVFIEERKFVILNNTFVELLHHSKWDLYAQYKCDLKEQGKDAGYGGTSQTSDISSPASVYLGGNVYGLTLPDGFETTPYIYYWLKKDGELTKFTSIKQLKKLYKDQKDAFNAYMEKHDVKYENPESILQLLEHLASNSNLSN